MCALPIGDRDGRSPQHRRGSTRRDRQQPAGDQRVPGRPPRRPSQLRGRGACPRRGCRAHSAGGGGAVTDPTEPTPFELEVDEEAAIQAAVPPPAGTLLIAEDIVVGYVQEENILHGVAVTVTPGAQLRTGERRVGEAEGRKLKDQGTPAR